jgi:hypothetical protein
MCDMILRYTTFFNITLFDVISYHLIALCDAIFYCNIINNIKHIILRDISLHYIDLNYTTSHSPRPRVVSAESLTLRRVIR